MSLGRRVTRIARGYLDQITDRLEEIEREMDRQGKARADAQSELQEALDPANPRRWPSSAASKVNPSAGNSSAETSSTSQSEWNLSQCYKVLGLPDGTDFALVRRTYNDLMKKCDPARFPADSEEHQKATQLRMQIDRAYKIMLKHFDPSAERFGELG
jgi:DnaJ-domain-containing protein 1